MFVVQTCREHVLLTSLCMYVCMYVCYANVSRACATSSNTIMYVCMHVCMHVCVLCKRIKSMCYFIWHHYVCILIHINIYVCMHALLTKSCANMYVCMYDLAQFRLQHTLHRSADCSANMYVCMYICIYVCMTWPNSGCSTRSIVVQIAVPICMYSQSYKYVCMYVRMYWPGQIQAAALAP